ncbi:MAG: hypothetical protein ACOYJA_05070 [Christensenellales bacterium]|jgi:hypothetical protein
MIRAIYGKKGSGKTKKIIDLANTTAQNNPGNTVFIDDDNRYMLDLDHKIRFINISDYGIKDAHELMGFLCGLSARDFDLDTVFIDAFLKICATDIADLEWLFNRMEALGQANNIKFVLSVSGNLEDAPAYVQRFIQN